MKTNRLAYIGMCAGIVLLVALAVLGLIELLWVAESLGIPM